MSKTTLTKQLEEAIFNEACSKGAFGCHEVSIGFGASCVERVDFMTYDTKGIFRCYEIKVSKADFHSKNHNTFCGHYNYYVLPKELLPQVEADIPLEIGIYVGRVHESLSICTVSCARRAKKQAVVPQDVEKLKDYFIRSLSRESEKVFKSESVFRQKQLQDRIAKAEKYGQNTRERYLDMQKRLQLAKGQLAFPVQ